MKKYNVLKGCVVNHEYYARGTVFTDKKDDGDKRYIETLIEHGFMKPIKEKRKTVWDLKDGDECWTRTSTHSLLYDTPIRPEKAVWNNSDIPLNSLRECGGVFLTQEDCAKDISWQKARQVLLRDTKGFKPKKDSGDYYCIFWDVKAEILRIGVWHSEYEWSRQYTPINFRTQEDAEFSTKNHRKEWLIYLGVEK